MNTNKARIYMKNGAETTADQSFNEIADRMKNKTTDDWLEFSFQQRRRLIPLNEVEKIEEIESKK